MAVEDLPSPSVMIDRPTQPPSAMRTALGILATQLLRLIVTAVALTAAVTLGVYSSRQMIARGGPFSTEVLGPWQHWTSAGQADADPYTRANLAQSGVLRLSSEVAGVFEATSDGLGAYLHSSCNYLIEGPSTNGQWWSLAVFDSGGKLITNESERYTFTSDTAAMNPDGTYIITLGRDARPGNWLPTSGAGRLTLIFTLLDPAMGLSPEERAERYKLLPAVRREACS
ncbi:MAG: DUF1214 domain-containing protein [Hyphomicrobium sp.]